MRRIVAVSDYCTHVPPQPGCREGTNKAPERTSPDEPHTAPYGSAQMTAHIARHGSPDILCIWGLGVTEQTLLACPDSIMIYNSLDVEAIRIPAKVSRHIDIFLTGSDAQSADVLARHPQSLIQLLPVGPEFASPETFFPTGAAKDFDVIYVAAAQPYKRHDILFDALFSLPRDLRCLCVMGYGEMGDTLRQTAATMGLNVTFIGPPGVSHDEVNLLMNRARVGVVCGIDDGAPAILTEYMLAGLPVLANDGLRCGLQYITPETGRTAPAASFADALARMLGSPEFFSPREAVLQNWAWPHSVDRLASLIATARLRRNHASRA